MDVYEEELRKQRSSTQALIAELGQTKKELNAQLTKKQFEDRTAELQDELNATRGELIKTKGIYANQKTALIEKKGQLGVTNQQLAELSSKYSALETSLKNAQASLDDALKASEQKTTDLNTLNKKLDEVQRKSEEYLKSLGEYQAQIKELTQAKLQLEEELKKAKLAQDNAIKIAEQTMALLRNAPSEKKVMQLEEQIKILEETCETLESQNEELHELVSSTAESMSDLVAKAREEAYEKAAKEVEKARAETIEKEKEIQDIAVLIDRLKAALNRKLQASLQKAEEEHNDTISELNQEIAEHEKTKNVLEIANDNTKVALTNLEWWKKQNQHYAELLAKANTTIQNLKEALEAAQEQNMPSLRSSTNSLRKTTTDLENSSNQTEEEVRQIIADRMSKSVPSGFKPSKKDK